MYLVIVLVSYFPIIPGCILLLKDLALSSLGLLKAKRPILLAKWPTFLAKHNSNPQPDIIHVRNRSYEGRIVACMFTKSQMGYRCGS
jgi:hypothetical protein